MTPEAEAYPYVLGIDLGSASIGWAMVRLDEKENPVELVKAGVRIFEPGVAGSSMDIERGKDQSKALDRRVARLQRRQLRRRAGRQRQLYNYLKNCGLLPPPVEGEPDRSLNRMQVLDRLDAEIREKWTARNQGADKQVVHQLLPYVLRKAALYERLEPFELGRVFYHLSQRRGFLSNRKETKSKDAKKDESSEVKKSISELGEKIRVAGAQTLGEYFAGLDPHEQRIRMRWTARAMYKDEFEKIWKKQQPHHPSVLMAEAKVEIYRLLFGQRRLMSTEHLIGRCELMPGERRAPWATWEAQRFRLLQNLNNLRIETADGQQRSLTLEEREAVLGALENEGDKTFPALRKLLGLAKDSRFNFERGGEKKLRGNRVTEAMREGFSARWDEFPADRKREIVREWAKSEDETKLASWAVSQGLLDAEPAAKWAGQTPEDGYCSFSVAAIRRLLPEMEKGIEYMTAARAIFPERYVSQQVHELIPIVHDAVPSLRNPAVERALTELRKVVNAVVRQHGKPYEIRIELARDLKKPRKQREEDWKMMRDRQSQREKLKERILKDCGLARPSRDDLEKALLHEECGGICPYTGRSIPFSSLFDNPQFEVEHILPFSRCPDDSFGNKTLCYIDENRNVKHNRTPWEAYGSDSERYEQVLERVRKFKNRGKLRRFEIKTGDELAEFTTRQLNDTRYASKLAARLLGTLYGGRDVERGGGWEAETGGRMRRVIFASSGMVTATLRRAWCLESILGEAAPSANGMNRGKPRTDHRHHAIDAIVTALTGERTVQFMNWLSQNAPDWFKGPRKLRNLPGPWPDFVPSIRPHIEQMTVSHRPEHKLTGQLHDATLYGKPRTGEKGKPVVHLRRPLSYFDKPDKIDRIVDAAVREAVRKRLEEIGGDPKLFEKPENLPYLPSGNGGRIPIRKVRVSESCDPVTVGQGPRQRFVQPANIHHVELFVRRDRRSHEYWDSVVVSVLDAMNRKRRGEPIVARKHPEDADAEFLFSLMKDDTVELNHNAERKLFRVKKFDSNQVIYLVDVNNAQLDKEQRTGKNILMKRPDPLRVMDPRKAVVDLIGQVHPAND